MSERSNLSIDDLCETIQQSTLLISESISSVIKALSMIAENLQSAIEGENFFPNRGPDFDDLISDIQKATENSKSKKKRSPQTPLKEKSNNKINIKTKTITNPIPPKSPLPFPGAGVFPPGSEAEDPRGFLLTPVISESEELKEHQKKNKYTLPKELFKMYEREEVPELFVKYARRKKMLCDLVPVFTDFVLYHSKKNSKMANWYAAWQTWVRNRLTFDPGCKNPENLASGRSLTPEDMGRILEN